jgi:hypothetical protein
MDGVNETVRWRGTVLAGTAGSASILQDDWSLATDDGAVLARVFRSPTETSRYFGSVCLGRASVAGDIRLTPLPSREMAMEACEERIATIAKILSP